MIIDGLDNQICKTLMDHKGCDHSNKTKMPIFSYPANLQSFHKRQLTRSGVLHSLQSFKPWFLFATIEGSKRCPSQQSQQLFFPKISNPMLGGGLQIFPQAFGATVSSPTPPMTRYVRKQFHFIFLWAMKSERVYIDWVLLINPLINSLFGPYN